MSFISTGGDYGGFGDDYLDEAMILDYKWDIIPRKQQIGSGQFPNVFLPQQAKN